MPSRTFSDTVETGDLSAWTSTSLIGAGTIAADSTRQHAGTYAIKSTLTSNSDAAEVYILNVVDDTGSGVSGWINLSVIPSFNTVAFAVSSNVGARVISIGITPAGILFASNASITSYNLGATVLVSNTWYRISFSYVVASVSNFTVNLYLNGVLELTFSNANGTLDNTGSQALLVGLEAGGAFSAWFDDVYVDNRSDLGDTWLPPPALRITHRPFAFTPGAGGRGLRR